ncbi:flavin reductase family protein [Hyphomonas sp.]|uniref:flavin reductase family protein n=1 Tax=Hyphomonas sp. TaxID=87 RepID=UPI003919DF67
MVTPYTEIGSALWREAMGGFLTGVTIVTALSPAGTPHGAAVNAFTAVSEQPPLLLVCLDRASRSLETIRSAGKFAVNILAEHHLGIVPAFASKGVADRFAGIDYGAAETGSPILPGAVAWFDCEVHAIHDGGDHEIVVGRVVAIGSDASLTPLAYHRGQIWRLNG